MAARHRGAHTDAAPLPHAPLLISAAGATTTHRALVMGILNRTPDSFYDQGVTFELDKPTGGPSCRGPTGRTSSISAG
jgi:hypothetical protein